MKRNTGMLMVAIFVGAVVFGTWAPTVAAADAITLKYANFPPAPTFPCVQMERWKTEVEKRTAGKVVVQTFPGGTLLDAKNMIDGVIAGTADIGCLSMAYQPGRFMVTNATSLPFGIPNAKVGSLVLWDLYEKYKPQEFAGVKVLAMFTTAPNNIMSKVAVKKLGRHQGAGPPGFRRSRRSPQRLGRQPGRHAHAGDGGGPAKGCGQRTFFITRGHEGL